MTICHCPSFSLPNFVVRKLCTCLLTKGGVAYQMVPFLVTFLLFGQLSIHRMWCPKNVEIFHRVSKTETKPRAFSPIEVKGVPTNPDEWWVPTKRSPQLSHQSTYFWPQGKPPTSHQKIIKHKDIILALNTFFYYYKKKK